MDSLFSRLVAIKTLESVLRENSFVYLAFSRYGDNLPSYEKRFCYEIIYGTLRNLYFLDSIILEISGTRNIDYDIENLLRIGVYQLIFMDSVPNYAAVHTTTELAKSISNMKNSRFVNAVMRKIIREWQDIQLPRDNIIDYLRVKYSFPKWIIEQLMLETGEEEIENLLSNLNNKPDLYIRYNKLRTDIKGLIGDLHKEGFSEVKRVKHFPDYLQIILPGKDLTETQSFKNGKFLIQDPTFSLPLKLLPSDIKFKNYLEIGASPGGKLSKAVELLHKSNNIYSIDLPHRNRILKNNMHRLGLLKRVILISGDATSLPFARNSLDIILLDPPCTSLGVIRRHPEIRYIKKPIDMKLLSSLQKDMIRSSSFVLKKGGTLIYSTCTLTRAENENIIKYAERYRLIPYPDNQNYSIKSIPYRFDGGFTARLIKD